MSYQEEMQELINRWHKQAQVAHEAHYEAGRFYEMFFLSLGIPVIFFSAFTGGSEVFDLFTREVNGVISLCIAILAGLQTFLKFSQRSERHRIAGARYGGIQRSLEEAQVDLANDQVKGRKEIDKIKSELDALAGESPEIPKRILKKYNPEMFSASI